MMTKKDFIAIKDILINYNGVLSKEHYEFLVFDFTFWLKEQNPNFKEELFIEACGVL